MKISDSDSVGQYSSFFDHIDNLKSGEGKKFATKKSLLAEKLIPCMTIDNMRSVLDIDEKMEELCNRITSWNS